MVFWGIEVWCNHAVQELGLSSYSSESRDATSKASKDGEQYHALFNTFYRLVFKHIASLVEVSLQDSVSCSRIAWDLTYSPLVTPI